MARQVRLYRWKSSRGENFGDWLGVPLLQAVGCEVLEPEPGQECVFAVGSILHEPHYGKPMASRVIVCGCGVGEGSQPPGNVEFRAVRGPFTRDLLMLPKRIPLGDPALLLPKLCEVQAIRQADPLFVQHCWNEGYSLPECTAASCLDAGLELVAKVRGAHFVASESLHGCIVAEAYNVPWAPCAPKGFPPRQSCVERKWQDWMQYLRLPPFHRFPTTLDEAFVWWRNYGRWAEVPSLLPLMEVYRALGG